METNEKDVLKGVEDCTREDGPLKFLFFNMNGLTYKKIAQLKRIQAETKADVISLCEVATHNSTFHVKDLLVVLEKVFTAFHIRAVQCNCTQVNKFAGRHGMVVLAKKELRSTMLDVPLTGCNEDDHRQICVDMQAFTGQKIRLVSVHYKSGNVGNTAEGLYKRIQMHSTAEVLSNAPEDAILVVGGDLNIHPDWHTFGEMDFIFSKTGLIPISVLDLWNWNAKETVWTHTGRIGTAKNMLDHVLISKGWKAEAKLYGPPDFVITTDHPNFLQLTLWEERAVHKKKIQYEIGIKRCEGCGRTYTTKEHFPCPFQLERMVTCYMDAKASLQSHGQAETVDSSSSPP